MIPPPLVEITVKFSLYDRYISYFDRFLQDPYPIMSSPHKNSGFNRRVWLTPHLTASWNLPDGLLNGQTRIQLEQSVPLRAQNERQVSELICQARTPSQLEIL